MRGLDSRRDEPIREADSVLPVLTPGKPFKTAHVRNSTAEFLIFTAQSGETSIEVRVEGETVWLTQKLMGTLFGVGVPTINEHLGNLFDRGEIDRDATIRKFRSVQVEGGREVARSPAFYNLDAIIAVGFRVQISGEL